MSNVEEIKQELSKVIDVNKSTFVRVREHDNLYRPLVSFMSSRATRSFEMDQAVSRGGGKKKDKKKATLTVSGIITEDMEFETQLMAGLGVHPVTWENEILYVTFQRVGVPVGTYSDAVMLEEFVVYAKGEGRQAYLHGFFEHVFKEFQTNDDDDVFRIYTWVIEDGYWKTAAIRQKRPMDSVVLPLETKNLIMTDLDQFMEPETSEWYGKHGIPMKRSYLLYGPPGTGKTSFLSAVASKYDLSLCFLQAGHPRMTDSSLHDALNQAPSGSIIVLEDVDALFTTERKSDSSSPLTFSGILNALDGLASPHGQLFFLTTNHPERLDPAMLRHGRVDVRAEFPHASEEQVAEMFRCFYPGSDVEYSVKFAQSLRKEWGQMNLAALQDFFIQNRLMDAKTAVDRVDQWLDQQKQAKDAMRLFEEQNKAKEEKKGEEKKGGEDNDEANDGDDDDDADGGQQAKKVQHKESSLLEPVTFFVLGLVAAAALSSLVFRQEK